jgi:hypothetical protein
MNLEQLVNTVTNKRSFADLKAYLHFCAEYLHYIAEHLQAVIVSQNENHYCFYQYKQEGNFQITRPINANLMYDAKDFSKVSGEFLKILGQIKSIGPQEQSVRTILNNVTYTIQQSIGATLDALPAGQSNTARKLNGDLFEHLIRLIIEETGIVCRSGTIQIPIEVEGASAFKMS